MALMDPQAEEIPQYKHIQRNDFFNRRHKKQKEEDIVVCDCRYNVSDPDSACGERCLNVLTSTECTPGYCPCGYYCKNQKFQRCEYAKSRLFKTGGRGWGVLADEDIKAGQFIIEYCGEVIPGTEARKRSHDYENQGLVDAYIISLNASESIDATKRGSLARFINHSCHPNCETRKWNVLGEIRVGIFAKQDIPAGTELAYDYNFEWYGGAKVRCLCGAPCCSGFLGAKSRGFQEATSYELQESECRFSVDNMPLYDSEEDEPTSPVIKVETSTSFEAISNAKDGFTLRTGDPLKPEQGPQFPDPVAVAVTSVPMEGVEVEEVKTEPREDKKLLQDENNPTSAQTNPITALFSSNNTSQNYQIQTVPSSNKKMQQYNKRSKKLSQKEVDAARVCQLLPSKEAREEVHRTEERKKQANSELNSLFEEIRPAIEEHERDNQDSVPTTVGEKWVESHCANMKAQFEFSSSIIKNLLFASQRAQSEKNVAEATEKDVN